MLKKIKNVYNLNLYKKRNKLTYAQSLICMIFVGKYFNFDFDLLGHFRDDERLYLLRSV